MNVNWLTRATARSLPVAAAAVVVASLSIVEAEAASTRGPGAGNQRTMSVPSAAGNGGVGTPTIRTIAPEGGNGPIVNPRSGWRNQQGGLLGGLQPSSGNCASPGGGPGYHPRRPRCR
jgi:hypothetical protein